MSIDVQKSHSHAGQKKYTIEKWDTYLYEANCRLKSQYNCNHISDTSYQEGFIEFMHNFARLYCNDLKEAYNCYKAAIEQNYIDECYELVDGNELISTLSRCQVLLITANQIEKAILHYCIHEKESHKKIERIIYNNNAYFIFKWDSYWVAHIHQPQTGSFKDWGLNATVSEALKYFRPNVIFSIGIAFGIDYKTQNIGDVLVSKKLFPYSENKLDEEEIRPDRSQDKFIDDWLDVRFVNANGFLDGVIYGGILSGGSVMSSFNQKDRICTAYSKNDYVIGGEMEGCALFQVSNICNIPCSVIKGICDWGVAKNDIFIEKTAGVKHPFVEEFINLYAELDDEIDDDIVFCEERFKECLQAYAMKKVIEKCAPLFHDRTIFSVSKTKKLEDEKSKNKLLICNNVIVSTVALVLSFIMFYLLCFVSRSNEISLLLCVFFIIVILLANFAILWFITQKDIYVSNRKEKSRWF